MNFLIIFLLVLTTVIADNDDLCQSCKCTNSDDAQTLTLDCTNKNLQHVGGQWPVQNQTNLIKVSYADNDMPTLEPLPITDAVVEIVLTRCNIKYLRPRLFADAKNVKFVDLSHNQLSAEEVSSEKFQGPFNNSLYGPIAIEHLDLSYNLIHSLGKNLFEHMPNLKTLNLEGNDFSILDIHTQLAISSIKSLQSLNLANNELTELVGAAIEGLSELTELDISMNELDFVPGTLSKIAASLQVLKLDSNPIFEFVSETFLGLNNIVELSCNNLTKLKFVNANTFAPMTKLKKLSLSNNFLLTDIDREAFGINQTLEELYLNNNVLYRIDYKLLPWSRLKVFEFTENSLDCSCDLYNISRELSTDITRTEDGPMCMDPRNERYVLVFYLKSDICDYKAEHANRREFIQYHYSMVKVALIVLSIIVMTAAMLAAILGFYRYRKYRRAMTYSYTSHVAYNPVSTTAKF